MIKEAKSKCQAAESQNIEKVKAKQDVTKIQLTRGIRYCKSCDHSHTEEADVNRKRNKNMSWFTRMETKNPKQYSSLWLSRKKEYSTIWHS